MPVQDIPDWRTAISEAQKIICPKTIIPQSFQEAAAIIGKATELLLISKNHKYGKGNILGCRKFGITPEQGILLRENDKTERLLNNIINQINLGKEDRTEGFGDKAGYSDIGIMLQQKTKNGLSWYELPITNV